MDEFRISQLELRVEAMAQKIDSLVDIELSYADTYQKLFANLQERINALDDKLNDATNLLFSFLQNERKVIKDISTIYATSRQELTNSFKR